MSSNVFQRRATRALAELEPHSGDRGDERHVVNEVDRKAPAVQPARTMGESVPERRRRERTSVSLIIPCWSDRAAAFELARRWTNEPMIHEVIVAGVEEGSPLPE